MNPAILEHVKQFNTHIQNFSRDFYDSPRDLDQACVYALNNPGKRIRPLIALLLNEALGSKQEVILPFATAIELVHNYSLIHDDLPAMDNDELRRGLPTVHIKFDEATAILAGDALLSDSFSVITEAEKLDPTTRINLIQELSNAIGSKGMLLGQSLDLAWHLQQTEGCAIESIEQVHLNKTAKLFAATTAGVGISNQLSHSKINELRQAGLYFGMALQLMDDCLDKEQDLTKEESRPTFLAVMDTKTALETARTYFFKSKALFKNEIEDAPMFFEFLNRYFDSISEKLPR